MYLYKCEMEIKRKRFEKISFYRKRFMVVLRHIVMKESTVLGVEKRNAACEMYGLILLFYLAITKALILAVAIEGLEHSTDDDETVTMACRGREFSLRK